MIVCNDMRNTGASALIIPNDFCADDCDDVGGIIGDAYSPVLALDQADDSGAFKMVPKLDDVEEMLTEVISHFKWESFIFIHEGGVGKKKDCILSCRPIIKFYELKKKIDRSNRINVQVSMFGIRGPNLTILK